LALADDRLFIRPWIELEPLVRIEAEYPIPLETAERRLLEEARVLFSGMVYGWTFAYTPGDKERKVEESFILTPIAEIPWGSPRLSVQETEVAGLKLFARICYSPSDDERARRASWAGNSAALSTGRGTANVFKGPSEKLASLREAMRDAVRSHLAGRLLNKPREIKGSLVLWEDPLTVVRAGTYTTTARVKLQVSEILPYRIF
jgi:hypothetical protein